MTEIALVFLVNLLSTVFKRWIFPRFGKTGIQVIVFILSIVGALYYTYKNRIVGLEEMVTSAIALFSLAVALYETVLSHFDFFKGNPQDKAGN